MHMWLLFRNNPATAGATTATATHTLESATFVYFLAIMMPHYYFTLGENDDHLVLTAELRRKEERCHFALAATLM